MVKKLALSTLFGNSSSSNSKDTNLLCPSSSSMSASSSWQWPSCKHPRTFSFRRDDHHRAYKTMNSAYFPDSADDSCFSNSFASVDISETLSTVSEASGGDANEAEAVVRALRSGRLFFEPESSTSSSSILNAATPKGVFDGATAMAIDSEDPFGDFRKSMEEMVMSHEHGVKDWRWLEEMLGWYLKANGKKTHGLIVGAFVDLLLGITTPSSPTNCSTTTCSSFTFSRGPDGKGGDCSSFPNGA